MAGTDRLNNIADKIADPAVTKVTGDGQPSNAVGCRPAPSIELLTRALKASANGIMITDRSGLILWVNSAFTLLTGYSEAELLAKTPALLKSGEHDAAFYESMWMTISTGNVWRGELVNRRKDGSRYFEEMTITPLIDAEGTVQNFIAIKQDISQRKEVERELARESSLLQALMDNLPDCIYFKDVNSRYNRINRAQARLLGLDDPQKAIGSTDMDFLTPRQARQTLVDERRIFVAGEAILDSRERILTASGKAIWVSATKVPIRDEKGDITGLVGVARDITERRLAEEQLAYERDLLRTLMDSSPDLIYFKDRNSRFIRCSKTMAGRFGLAHSEEVAGKNDFDFFKEDYAKAAWSEEQEIMRTGKPLIGKVERENWKDKTEVTWVFTNKLPFRNKDGEIIGTFGISKDITQLKQAELERQNMEGQLRQAQKLEAIGQLAAGIAHEINTPTQYVGDNTRFLEDSFADISKALKIYDELLTAARNNAVTPELVARVHDKIATCDLGYLFEQIPAAIKETLEGVDRVTKIVRAMKEFSHPGNKEKTAADLNRAIESTVTVARNEWKYIADLKMDLASDLPPVLCYLGEFNQAVLNLLVNAAHAIAEVVKKNPGSRGVITVSTRRNGNFAEIRVGDTGTGIPEEIRPRIFELFFTTKDVGKGTGQGLSSVYSSIVKKLGGTVTFETEVGKGTVFILSLPLAAPTGPTPTGVGEPGPAASPPPAETVAALA